MALSADTIPTIVGDAILESLRENLVYGRLFNTDYQGDVAPGNAVKIPAIGSVTIGDYVEYTDMDDEAVADDSQTLTIDQQKYFSIVIDDIDRAMSKPAIMAAYAREAAHQLQTTMDSYLAGVLAAGGTLTADLGTDVTPLEINSANIGETLRLIARKLDDALVPRNGRYVVLPPWAIEDLVTVNVTLETNNADTVRNGFISRWNGFDILMSHNVPNDEGDAYKIIAGSTISQTMAMAIDKTEMVRHQTQFADKFRGLMVYGSRVTRPAALAVATWNEADES